MIIREHYLAKIRPFYDSDLIAGLGIWTGRGDKV